MFYALHVALLGIMEAVDMIIITKGDNELLPAAQHTKANYLSALQFIQPKYPSSSHMNWLPSIYISSTISKLNFNIIEENIYKFHHQLCTTGYINTKRSEQKLYWLQQKLHRLLLGKLQKNKNIQVLQKVIENQVKDDKITPATAAQILLDEFIYSIKTDK